MPGLDGFKVLEILTGLVPAEVFVPIIILTADTTVDARRKALANGATDFLTKPFDTTEVRLRVRNALTMRRLHTRVHQQNAILEQRVQERTQELELARLETLDRLAIAAEFRDDATGQHTARVARIAANVALTLGYEPVDLAQFSRAAALHDIGKIAVPDHILLKPGSLSIEERDEMRKHTMIGAGILGGSHFATLQLAADIAMSHHERWDGKGYPRSLTGKQIPLAGRIVAVADVFDALTHDRPYKPAWSVERALYEIQCQAGTQFDPDVVQAFVEAIQHERLDQASD
jgi:putative two-component system response regulator